MFSTEYYLRYMPLTNIFFPQFLNYMKSRKTNCLFPGALDTFPRKSLINIHHTRFQCLSKTTINPVKCPLILSIPLVMTLTLSLSSTHLLRAPIGPPFTFCLSMYRKTFGITLLLVLIGICSSVNCLLSSSSGSFCFGFEVDGLCFCKRLELNRSTLSIIGAVGSLMEASGL